MFRQFPTKFSTENSDLFHEAFCGYTCLHIANSGVVSYVYWNFYKNKDFYYYNAFLLRIRDYTFKTKKFVKITKEERNRLNIYPCKIILYNSYFFAAGV